MSLIDKLLYKKDNRIKSVNNWEGIFKTLEDAEIACDLIRSKFGFIGYKMMEFKIRKVKAGYEIKFTTPNTEHDEDLEVLGLGRSYV